MKKITGLVCVLFSGCLYAAVPHVDDSNIVGAIVDEGAAVCFDKDGDVTSKNECDMYFEDSREGYVELTGNNWSGRFDFWDIGGCGTSVVNPVSSAVCPLTQSSFSACTSNGYVLVQTSFSYHYFALRANENCTGIATPESVGIIPCRTTDSFDPLTGCTRPPSQHAYIRIDTTEGSIPPSVDCAIDLDWGKMVVDDVNDLLYICTQSGWISK